MIDNFEILIALLEKIGIAALIVLTYRMIRHARWSVLWTGPVIGVIFSAGAVATMIDPIVVMPGVIVDIRTVMVGLSALFGGFSAAIIASAVTIAVRLYIGGAGALAGCVSIVIAAIVALIYARVSGNRRDVPGLAVLGLLMSVNFVAVVLLPGEGVIWSVLSNVPILVARNILGAVILGHLLAMEDTREEEFERVKQEAERDPLTGLSNRRVLDVVAHQQKAQRDASVFSVILFDIDHFKRINDTYGHDFGDRVLARVSALIAGRMRGGDVVVRYGGEEICVVVADSRGHNTVRVADDIRLQVAGERFIENGEVVSVTISAGVAQADENASTVYQVLKLADEALYEAKGAGRNRVTLYAP